MYLAKLLWFLNLKQGDFWRVPWLKHVARICPYVCWMWRGWWNIYLKGIQILFNIFMPGIGPCFLDKKNLVEFFYTHVWKIHVLNSLPFAGNLLRVVFCVQLDHLHSKKNRMYQMKKITKQEPSPFVPRGIHQRTPQKPPLILKSPMWLAVYGPNP